jgi:hypothetical protein
MKHFHWRDVGCVRYLESTDKSFEFYQERDKIVLSTGDAGPFTQSSQNGKCYKHQYEKVIILYSKFEPLFLSFLHIDNTRGVCYESKSCLDSLRGHIG